jgi:hypothetical protein
MPRDANGNYTLPAGNPVVSGTPISSAVQNSTMSDIAQALSDSLSRSGLGGMLAALPFADGLIGSPSITFTSELTTGFYKPGNLTFAAVVTGQQVVLYGQSSVTLMQVGYQWVAAAAAQFRILNRKEDYVTGGNGAILGQWEFTYDGTTFKGPQIATKGGMLFNDAATQTSGAVRIVTAAPAPGAGKPGDIWLVV